jgi:hypothetical protein
MLIDLHGLVIACESSAERIRERWSHSFSSRPQVIGRNADITFSLNLTVQRPDAPAASPSFTQGDLLSVYQRPNDLATQRPTDQVTIHFPRFGQLRIDLSHNRIEGELAPAALDVYGVFEDMVAMGLTALLRRRHLFLIHAFAAAYDGRAVLLVGDIGSGKTTTGISLLRAGWKLLSNDSPLLTDGKGRMANDGWRRKGEGRKADSILTAKLSVSEDAVMALAYPGLLSAYPDTLRRFPELAALPHPHTPTHKTTFAAESVYPDVWLESAPVRAIVFPHVAHTAEHHVTRLKASEALRRLLPNAIDRWDTEMIPTHLQLLTTFANTAPAYHIELGEQVETLPSLFEEILGEIRGDNVP